MCILAGIGYGIGNGVIRYYLVGDWRGQSGLSIVHNAAVQAMTPVRELNVEW